MEIHQGNFLAKPIAESPPTLQISELPLSVSENVRDFLCAF